MHPFPLPEDPSEYYPLIYSWVFLQVVSSLRFSNQNPVCTSLSICTTYPTHLFLLDLIIRIFVEEYRSLISSICSFLHSPVILSLLGPNIFLSTLFSNTLILHSSLSMSDQISHPYKTTGKKNYSSVYLNLYILGEQTGRFQTFDMFWMLYAFFWVIPWYLNFVCQSELYMPMFQNTLSVPSS